MFFPLMDKGIPWISSAFNNPIFIAAMPTLRMILLSTFSSPATFTAEPRAIPKVEIGNGLHLIIDIPGIVSINHGKPVADHFFELAELFRRSYICCIPASGVPPRPKAREGGRETCSRIRFVPAPVPATIQGNDIHHVTNCRA